MSQVTINIDTKTGDLTLNIDGEKFDSVEGLNVYTYRGTDHHGQEYKRVEMGVRLRHEQVGDNVCKYVTLSTANSKFTKANQFNKIDVFHDFEVFKDSNLEELSKAAAVLLGRKNQ
jgi:hypothetical protein